MMFKFDCRIICSMCIAFHVLIWLIHCLYKKIKNEKEIY